MCGFGSAPSAGGVPQGSNVFRSLARANGIPFPTGQPPPPPPPPPPAAKDVRTSAKIKAARRDAARRSTSQLRIPFNSVNVP